MQLFKGLKRIHNQKGSILIAIVVTMVVVSAMGAGLVAITSTSVFNQTGSNSTSNAFHLAEAGYRYALSNIATIQNLHNQTFTLAGGNSFTIIVNNYDFDIQSTVPNVIPTQIPYGNVPFESITDSGRIAVGGTVYVYSSIDVSGTDVDFTIPAGGALPGTGKVQLAALVSGTPTIVENGTITFQINSLNLFPARNGTFTIGINQYLYNYRTANTLKGITAFSGSWPGDFTLNNGDPVILDNCIEIVSTGNYGSALSGSQSLLAYNIPLNSGAGGGDDPEEPFEDTDNWSPETGDGSTGEGGFDTEDVDGDSALIITSTTDVIGALDTSSIDYQWEGTSLDLDEIWRNASYFLSYNVQVKIMIDEPDPSTYEPQYQGMADNYFYMAGINFRKRDNGDTYGLSFFRAEPDNADGIPDAFNPLGGGNGNGGQDMVLLWERIGGYGGGWRWLAYANLSGQNLMREAEIVFEDDFESGLGNWTGGADPFDLETIEDRDGVDTQTITDSPGGNYSSNTTYEITSNPIDVTGYSSLTLSFWHKYNTQNNRDICEVEVRANGGGWQSLATYNNRQDNWEEVSFGLDNILPADTVEIRFTLDTNRRTNRDGWNIDDVKIVTLSPKWVTLMLHLEEKLVSGSKTNEIKAYISDGTPRGTANDIPQDDNRLANPRGEVNWPAYNVDDTNSSNDYFTLIRWDGINTNVAQAGVGRELESIIRVDNLLSPDAGTFTLPELGLHAWGWNFNVTYFDDFAVTTDTN